MKLSDSSPMPFGKHKGTPMQDVPAKYLDWLWGKQGEDIAKGNKFSPTQAAVFEYISDNLDVINAELGEQPTRRGN